MPTNPNHLALKLFTNYDGQHHGFGAVSISDRNNGDPNLFSTYAALNPTGTAMTLLVLNKDPGKTDQMQFTFSGFTPSHGNFLHAIVDELNPDCCFQNFGVVLGPELCALFWDASSGDHRSEPPPGRGVGREPRQDHAACGRQGSLASESYLGRGNGNPEETCNRQWHQPAGYAA